MNLTPTEKASLERSLFYLNQAREHIDEAEKNLLGAYSLPASEGDEFMSEMNHFCIKACLILKKV